jgi:hypothetical protein
VSDQPFEDTERRLRSALHRLADSHQPDPDRHWPTSHPNGKRRPDRPSPTRRWLLVAASIVVVMAGVAAVAVVQRDGDDPATDLPPTPTSVDPIEDSAVTTVPEEPSNSVPDSVPPEDPGVVRFPIDAAEQDAEWIVPWSDGFLAGSFVDRDDGDATTVRARFTTDGESWEPVDMTMPPGLIDYGTATTVGDRFVVTAAIAPTADADVVRVASTTDLLNWSVQDFDVPGPRPPQSDVSELGGSLRALGSFAANETGWVFEVRRVYAENVATATLDDDLLASGFQIRSDDNGFTVAANGPGGTPPTPDTTFDYTWDEVGIAPAGVPFMTGEIPASRTWTATWDGTPTVSQTAVPTGPTLASSEGFVRWNDHTWFSADGLTWSASPLPDPTGTVQNAFAIDGGFIAIVTTQNGTSDLYRLDERGGDPRLLDLADVPDRLATGFAGRSIPGPRNEATHAALLLTGVGQARAPFIIDSNGYRLIERQAVLSLVDMSTGDTVLTYEPLDGPPAADTWFEFGNDDFTATDPATDTVLMQIPMETYRNAQAAHQAAMDSNGVGNDVGDLLLFASRDGERFLVEPLGPDNPSRDTPVDLATNGDIVLVRLGDEWVRYELPS